MPPRPSRTRCRACGDGDRWAQGYATTATADRTASINTDTGSVARVDSARRHGRGALAGASGVRLG